MMSQPMDVPESTKITFEMVLTQPNFVFVSYDGHKSDRKNAFDTICSFEWTGLYMNSCRLYKLTDIRKI